MNEIKSVLSAIGDYFAGANWFLMAKWPFWVLLFVVAAGGVYTARFGKKTLICRGISGTLNLCGIYQTAILLYTVWPFLRSLPFGLPFLVITEESVSLADLGSMDLDTLAPVLLQGMFLMLLVDFVESLNPGGKTLLSWLFSQFVTVSISLSAYMVVVAGFSYLVPCALGWFAMIPVGLALLVFLLMLCGKLIFTVVMESGNPEYKKAYDFFTTGKFGSLLTVSALSFLFAMILFLMLHVTGNSVMKFASANKIGLAFILLLMLISEYVYAMFYCGKKS